VVSATSYCSSELTISSIAVSAGAVSGCYSEAGDTAAARTSAAAGFLDHRNLQFHLLLHESDIGGANEEAPTFAILF
jgi:hypothetical protein